MVDTADLSSVARNRREGSSPSLGTNNLWQSGGMVDTAHSKCVAEQLAAGSTPVSATAFLWGRQDSICYEFYPSQVREYRAYRYKTK